MKNIKHISDVPKMKEEWDYSKNDGDPSKIAFRTHASYWWKCSLGHSWEASPHNRATGRDCPYCTNRKVLKGFNDLASQKPELAGEWDYEKNGDLAPADVIVTSSRKVWWKCSEGHSWKTIVLVRSSYGCGCPYCTNRKILAGYNDLATLKPELLSEWDYERNTEITPQEIGTGSDIRVWWKCGKGHRWQTSVVNRAGISCTGCPYCVNRKVMVGDNDLGTSSPELLLEWDYEKNVDISPDDVTYGSSRVVWWKCKNEHRWEAPVYARKGSGCPYCANVKVWPGYNDVASQLSDIIDEWDYEKNSGMLPEEILAVSTKKVWWKCSAGHSWKMSPAQRKRGVGCPFDSGRHAVAGYNDLETLHPELMEQWDYDKNILYSPERLLPHSNVLIWWKCSEGHSWRTSPNHRLRGSVCPYCENKKVLPGYNDLASRFPEIAAEWDYEKNDDDFTPDCVMMHSSRYAYWRCKNGHSWKCAIANRSSYNHECPYCNGQRAIKGENDLATVSPEIAAEWDMEKNAPLTPDKVMAGSAKKVWWKCVQGHSWKAMVYSRKNSQCPYCNKHPIEMKTSFIS